MPPKKTTTTKIKRKTGSSAQPTLSFSQKKPGTSPKKSKKAQAVKEASPTSDSEPELELSPDAKSGPGRKSLNPKSKEWAGVYRDAQIAMGNMEPIHAGPDTHNQVHHILRVFDMTSKYGPSVGITRLERWERAKKWGLNPPDEIQTILMTKEGQDDADYRENVLHTWI